ncbi:MAG: transcription-repair coupling factor [Chloroflexi bacterium]|nr:transcription-repair coupling factor [Chloroflexota bacterium]
MLLKLTPLLDLVEENPGSHRIIKGLQTESEVKAVVPDAAKPYLIASLYEHLQRPLLVLTSQPENARKLYEQVSVWAGPGTVTLFSESEALPYERISADTSVELERLQVLAALAGAGGTESPAPLVIASAPALSRKLLSVARFKAACYTIRAKEQIRLFDLLERWQAIGYRLEDLVEMPGMISHRGGIIDIFSPGSDLPARVEFFGDTIESIRLFDPSTQRSLRAVPSITISPATELLAANQEIEMAFSALDLSGCTVEVKRQFEKDLAALLHGESAESSFYAPALNGGSLLDYLPAGCLVVLDEPDSLSGVMADLDVKAIELRSEMTAEGTLPKNFPTPYFLWDDLEPLLKSHTRLVFVGWGYEEDTGFEAGFAPAPNYAGHLPGFVSKVRELLAQRQRVIIVSQQASRLSEVIESEGIIAPPLAGIENVPEPGSMTLLQGSLAEGWVMGNTCLFTDAEIFGFVKQRRLLKKHPVPHHKLYIDIRPGDYVVHVEHGIGRFAGVTILGATNTEKEYLVLEYAAGDKLYVPTDQIDRVTRYIGAGEKPPVLSRLGTQEWSRVKQRVKESVANIAEELLALYAAREVVPGFAFSPDNVWQREFESAFPYEETPDQLDAVSEVKEDMEKTRPMDRLVCGDVGYGKTEVAIRAAFKAVMDGKQVGVLVPTTVLAAQHFATFTQRFAAFPIKIEMLSRFRSHREQKAVIEALAHGTVDICIGTHRLIQKDVIFKDLGLLVIDEEQRFGVTHKEFFKRKRQEVDVLTLSATPIPRTLHMSLVGVRDMSVMETPPEERLPVKTYVAEYNDRLVREAILRELERNGQVFFVHNRVQSIAFIAGRLQELVPEARFAIGHGQMDEEELERVMADFVQSKADVLVCTSIIESGLDMPNVNTLIVNNADRFGLTQLYQLRGRVGRGANLAYAYFLYEKGKRLTDIARKRLRTIYEATELGAGFGVAMKDLEIRGAGTLLGVKQSGHISAVGFSLYTQLLAQAVEELKAKKEGRSEEEVKKAHLPPPTIDLPFPAFIPEGYVTELEVRIALYQRLGKIEKAEQVESLARELKDRFGMPPREVENLLYALRIRALAAMAGIESVSTQEGEIIIRRFDGMRFDTAKLGPFLRGLRVPVASTGSLQAGSIHFDALQIRLHHRRLGEKWREVLEEVVKRVD